MFSVSVWIAKPLST